MTRETLLKAFEMRIDGYSFDEIAYELNYDQATVWKTMNAVLHENRSRVRPGGAERLSQLIKDEYGSIRCLSKRTGVPETTISRLLRGSQPLQRNMEKLRAVVGDIL